MSGKPPLHPNRPVADTDKGWNDQFSFNQDMSYDAFWLANKKLLNFYGSKIDPQKVYKDLKETRKHGGRRRRTRRRGLKRRKTRRGY